MSPELKLRDAGAPTLQPRTDRGIQPYCQAPSIAASIMLIPSRRTESIAVEEHLSSAADSAENIGIFYNATRKKYTIPLLGPLEHLFTRSGRMLTS